MALRDDNINMHINLDSIPAQDSIRKLAAENRDLEKTNKAVRLEMEKLKAQGKENGEEFKQLEAAYKSNTSAINKNIKEIDELKKSLSLNDMTMTQLRKHAKDLQSQLDHTVQAADPKGYADLQKQLEATQGRMGELKGAGQSLTGQLSNIPGPAGAVTKGILGIKTAFTALLANPIVAIIAAIAAVFMALYKAIHSSEETLNKFNRILAPFKALMDGVLNVIQTVVSSLLDFVLAVSEGVRIITEKIPLVGGLFKKMNDFEREAIKLEEEKQALIKRERDTLVENAEAEMRVSQLRTEAKRKDLFTSEQRLAKIEEAIKLEQEMADKEYANTIERLRIESAEAERAKNKEEVERRLAELKAETFKAQKQYHDRSRELTEQMNTARAEVAAEEKARQDEIVKKQKETITSQLKNVDKEIAAEKAKLLQAKLDKEISQKEFNEKMEALELESLNRKLAIHGLEKEKREEINRALIDAKLKFQEEEEKRTKELTEKLRLDALSKNEKELDDIRNKYKEKQRLLQESLEYELLTEAEYTQRLTQQKADMQAELDNKQAEQDAVKAAEKMAKLDEEQEEEKVKLMEKYADSQITQEEYQQGLLELEQQFLDEKLRINGLTEEQITKLKEQQLNKQISDQEKSLKKQEARQKKYTQMFLNFAGDMGTALGEALTNSENSFADALGDVLLTALDGLRQMMTIYITETTIRNVSHLGFIGLAKAAAEIALINAAFAAIKGVIKRPSKNNAQTDTSTASTSGRMEVKQHARGKYDVLGKEDGRTYKNVPFIGSPATGIIKQPALIAEQGEELIISSPDLQMLKKHINYPYIVSAINDVRAGTVPQHAEGNYSGLEPMGEEPENSGQTSMPVMEKIAQLLEYLINNGVYSIIGLDELDAKRKLRDDARNIGTLNK